MKYFLLSDNIDTHVGMNLAGVEGVIVHSVPEALKAFSDIIKDKDIGVLLITELVQSFIKEEIKIHKLSGKIPLIFIIPDRHGWRRDKNFITSHVENAIGVKINDTDG